MNSKYQGNAAAESVSRREVARIVKKQHKQCTYNITVKRFRVTIVAVQKQ